MFKAEYDQIEKNINDLERKCDIVFEVVSWLITHNQDASQLAQFIQQYMIGYKGNIALARNAAKMLRNAADPNEPDDLPF